MKINFVLMTIMKDLAMEIMVKVYMEVVTLSQVIPSRILRKIQNTEYHVRKYKGDRNLDTCILYSQV